MRSIRRGLASDRNSIRARLGLAMALALLPVLLLGVVEGWVAYDKAAAERRHVVAADTQWVAAAARDRLRTAALLLEAASSSSAQGTDCDSELERLADRSGLFSKVVRLAQTGEVICSSPGQVRPGWWRGLTTGLSSDRGAVQFLATSGAYDPIVVTAMGEPSGGALVGIVTGPDLLRGLLPPASGSLDVKLLSGDGIYPRSDDAETSRSKVPGVRFTEGVRSVQGDARSVTYSGRISSSAPLLGRDLSVVLSTPSPGLFSWARVNIISSILLPLIAFAAALFAVWLVTEQVVVRWLHYVERIAAIYAKGRFTVRPLQADRAPAEIRGLAHTLDDMADTIAARDHSLRDSLAQKDAMMREIHHRVKNNLQVITSLLNMQQRSLTDPAARAAMTDTRQRISALALIYRALYQGPDLKRVDLRNFLEELLAQIISSEPHHGALVRTELEADELIIDPDKLAPLALFAVEAVTNAQKHAFARQGGTLRVRFKVEGENARLEIADDAPGVHEAADAGQGVGRMLMAAFARQLRGKAEFGPNIWGGATTSLLFPTPEAPHDPDAAMPQT